uniref:Ribonuclease H-like domain-containing protein n=1 Tax=Tanacetum cinerariifolium TaxID=118510 RepID=A0A6L2JNC1_TANCI|nr:ribonuclease H-like domain-containing protein [Tanacetum cinerariifolium]
MVLARVMWRLFVVVGGRGILRDQGMRCGHFKDQEMDCGACLGHPQQALKNKGIVDSGCSRHMTGNKAYLADYQEINDGGFVTFGSSRGGGDILVRASTTASLDAQQDSSNITKIQSKATLNEPTPQGEGSGSVPGRQETMGGIMAQIRSEGTLIQSIDPLILTVGSSKRHSLGRSKVSKQGRKNLNSQHMFNDNDLDKDADTEMIVEDKGNGEKGGSTAEIISTVRPYISAARPEFRLNFRYTLRFAPQWIGGQIPNNNNGWLEEDPEEEPKEEEIEDEDMVNDEEDDAEVINPYEKAYTHNRPPPASDEETEFAPLVIQIADVDDVPIPHVIQFGSSFHVGESSATRDLLAGNSKVYAPGPMCCDLKSVHRGVKRLSKQMHDRCRMEKKMAKKLRQDELCMNGQEFDITALDSAVRENRSENSKMMRLITDLSREFTELKNQDRMAKELSHWEAWFHETEGAVGLVRWFKKMENTFEISECVEGKKVNVTPSIFKRY